jgi:hypothetical protein
MRDFEGFWFLVYLFGGIYFYFKNSVFLSLFTVFGSSFTFVGLPLIYFGTEGLLKAAYYMLLFSLEGESLRSLMLLMIFLGYYLVVFFYCGFVFGFYCIGWFWDFFFPIYFSALGNELASFDLSSLAFDGDKSIDLSNDWFGLMFTLPLSFYGDLSLG